MNYLVIFDTLDGCIGLEYECTADNWEQAIELTKEQYPESINHSVVNAAQVNRLRSIFAGKED